MSAQLSTYKRFLSKYATKLETVIARFKDEGLETVKFSDEETTDLSTREKQRLLEEGIGAIETCNTKVQEILQNCAIALDKYGSLSDKEVEDFEQYSNRAESVLCSSHDYIVLLKARLNAFTSYPATRSMHITSNNDTEHEGALGVKKMELPTLPIPTFYGDLWEWDNFWTLFDANVNSQPLPELYKFNYLIKALKGEPLQAIKRFRVSQENYEKAVNFLKTKYGDKEQLINRLYERLERLQLNSPAIRDQRKLLEQIQALVTQLQEKNEHVDNQCTIEQVLSKFPNKLQRKVLERKYTQAESTFGMETLLKLLEEFITTEEKVSLFTREVTPKQHPTSPTFLRRKEEPTRGINKCMYCGQDHKAIACTKYTTPQSRAQYLRENKLCLICASAQHTSTVSPTSETSQAECRKRMCFVCQGPHHTSCCFKYDFSRTHKAPASSPASSAPSPASYPASPPAPPPAPRQKPVKQIDEKATQGPQRRQTKTRTPLKIHQINEAKESEGTICELQRENRKNSVYLPMGQLQVMDPNTKNLRKIPVLLDTGAELSFIDSNLAEELHVPTIKATKLRLSTFGSNKVNETMSRKVELDAWDAEGNAYQLQLLTYNTLTKPLKTPPLRDEDIRFMQSLNLNVNLTTTQHSKSLILLGCDQLWQLVKEDASHIRLPSGLHLLPTKLGHLLTGQMYQEGQVTQVEEDDEGVETWDNYWSLESQVNGVVGEVKVRKDFKQATSSNASRIRKRSTIKASSSVPKQTKTKLTKKKIARTNTFKSRTNFRKMAQSADEFDDLITIAKNKIPKSVLLGHLVTAKQELNNQVERFNTFKEDWDHTKQKRTNTKEARRDKIIILLNSLRAATLARESYTKLCTRYILLAKWLGSFPHVPNESEQDWIDDELLENMKIMNKQMSTLVSEMEKEADVAETPSRKPTTSKQQKSIGQVKGDGPEQIKNEDKRAEQMDLDVPKLVADEEQVAGKPLAVPEQDVTMDDELQDKLTQRRQLRQEIEEIEKALDALPLRQLGEVEGGTHVHVTCAFCHEKNKHYSDSCPLIIDGNDRFLISQGEGLCIRCLRHCAPGKCHFSRKPCFYCRRVQGTIAEEFRPRDRGHHRALCTVPNFEGMLRQKELDTRNEYQELEQEILQLQERQGVQRASAARRHEQH